MTLSSLIERLEKAEGPDRELDADIAAAVLGGEIQWQTAMTGDALPVRKYPSKDHIRGFGREPVQRYTSSIDAALTFVPEGSQWTIEADTAWVRQLSATDVDEFQGGFFCRGGTCTAIAICIAALRAQAAIEGGGNG